MSTRNVVLTRAQSELIDRLVASGRFRDATDALQAGLRLLEQEEAELAAIRDRIRTGIAQVQAGDFAEGSGEEAIRKAFAIARERG